MKLRLTLQVKTSPDGGRSMLRSLILYHPSTCWAERQDWPPRRCSVHRWPRKRIQAEWSQFPWDAFSHASHKEFLQFNLQELYIIIVIIIIIIYIIYIYFLFGFLTCDANSLKTLTQPGFMRKILIPLPWFPSRPHSTSNSSGWKYRRSMAGSCSTWVPPP